MSLQNNIKIKEPFDEGRRAMSYTRVFKHG
jgi:hypothetical protein